MLTIAVTTLCEGSIGNYHSTTTCMHSWRLPIEDGGGEDEVKQDNAYEFLFTTA